jgi:hypothetical protein
VRGTATVYILLFVRRNKISPLPPLIFKSWPSPVFIIVPELIPALDATFLNVKLKLIFCLKSIQRDLLLVTSPQGAIIDTNGALEQCS